MPTISVITPTFRREALLARCVESILAQHVDARVQHIVVNDAGTPLAPAPWMDDGRVIVLNTFQTERCVARNTGAALSEGQWLYFLDDDDYALPGALAAMLAAAQQDEPVMVYGGYRIHNEKQGMTDTLQPQLPPDVFPMLFAGEILPLQATWLKREQFFAAGGFDPFIKAAQDVDLLRRIALSGTAVGMGHLCAQVRVEHSTSTTQWTRQWEFWHMGMEKCQRLPATLPRLLAGTQEMPYWRGRCAREYVAAAARKIKIKRTMNVPRRLAAAARLSLGYTGCLAFQRGLRRLPQL